MNNSAARLNEKTSICKRVVVKGLKIILLLLKNYRQKESWKLKILKLFFRSQNGVRFGQRKNQYCSEFLLIFSFEKIKEDTPWRRLKKRFKLFCCC